MALTNRGKTWHCHFVMNGQRFRQSLGTRDWREAQAKEKDLIARASEGKLAHNSTTLARQPFGRRRMNTWRLDNWSWQQLAVRKRSNYRCSKRPLQAGTAEGDHREGTWRISDMASSPERRPRDPECRAWHRSSHPEASEALGACCRRCAAPEGAEHHRTRPNGGGYAEAPWKPSPIAAE